MALTKISTDGVKDDAVTTDKLANAINTERTANTAKVSTTINNNAADRIITGSGTANTLEGESTFTYDNGGLNIAGNSSRDGLKITQAGSHYGELCFNSNRTGENQAIAYIRGEWDGTEVGAISIEAGDDTTNKDDAKITFYTAQGGTISRKMAIEQDGHVHIDDGDLKFASGHGIDFSATFDGSNVSNVTSTSELLDDYEEGTFQPILKRLMTNNVTETNFYTQGTREGNYTRIGDRVWITGRIHWSGGSTGSGKLIMTNLPFTINTGGANEIPLNIGYRSGINYTNVNAYGAQNMNRFYITFFDSNGTYHITPSATASTGSFYFAAHYELV